MDKPFSEKKRLKVSAQEAFETSSHPKKTQKNRRLQYSAAADEEKSNTLFGNVLEGEFDAGPKGSHFPSFYFHVELGDFGNPQIAETFSGGFHGLSCRILPGIRTGAD
jgi:hypothetical protein